jgi:integrase
MRRAHAPGVRGDGDQPLEATGRADGHDRHANQAPPARLIGYHDLRHTFGTLAVRSAPVTDVQHWMGHADLATTMRYVHYVPQHDNAARLTAAFTAESVHPDVHRTGVMHP